LKIIGLIGGMSWESSREYYRLINEGVREALGGFHSAECVLYSLDFAEIEAMQQEARWEDAAERLIEAAKRLADAGADFFLICTNTMHKLAGAVEPSVGIPLLHIADATGEQVVQAGLSRVGLLGTRFTMEEDFYIGRLRTRYNLDVLIPPAEDRERVDRIIFDELVLGTIRSESKDVYREIMARLVEDGAQGIILGCTEIGLLVGQDDVRVPVFDTTRIHAAAAVARALG
jgi:aspartate racemase